MITQRFYSCHIYNNDIVTLLFYGGVWRFSKKIIIFGSAIYSLSGTKFAGWSGITYSSSHAFRDMMAYLPHTGTIYDLYSVMADAPYSDTSTNIGGTNDFTLLISSGFKDRSKINSFYFTQFYRLYDTGDRLGDEIIQYKMGNSFCISNYF